MATTIITKNGSGAPLAGDLTAGELAVDLTNKRLYSKDSGGNVIELGSGSSTVSDLTVSGDLTVDTNTFVVDSTNNRVGVGTQSPTALLDVAANLNPTIRLKAGLVGNDPDFDDEYMGGIEWFTNDTSGIGAHIGASIRAFSEATGTSTTPSYALIFSTSLANTVESEAMRITRKGDVGIGTDNPTSSNSLAPVLEVKSAGASEPTGFRASNSSASSAFDFFVDGSKTTIDVRGGQPFTIETSNNERFRVSSDGNVGIGTGSSVDTKLHVENSSGIASVKIESGGAGTQSNLYFQDANTTVDGSIRIGSAGNDFRFFTSSTERMRITSSGNVGINNTNPDVPLCVGVDAGNTLAARFGTLSSAKDGDDVFVRLQARDSGSSNKYFDIRHLVDDAALTINGPTSSLPEILRIDADGIKFGGQTAAAHALDDYEEGNWYPVPEDTAGNAATFTTRVGYYVKIGRFVYVTVDLVNINTTGCTAADPVLITGLPFTPVTGAGNTYHTSVAGVAATTGLTSDMIGCRITENVDYIVLSQGSGNLMGNLVDFQNLTSGSSDIRLSISYYTAE